ncbi:MAG: glycosyltransferase [Acidimicrobiia bacterium]
MTPELLTYDRRPLVLYASAGYTTHDRRFLEAIVDAGWDVAYVRFDGNGSSQEQRPVPDGVRSIEWLGTTGHMRADALDSYVAPLRELIDSLRPDVVHAGPVPTVGWVAATAGASALVTMSWGSDLLEHAREEPDRSRGRVALQQSGSVIVDCAAVGEAAVALGAAESKLVTFPWGVDLDAFDRSPTRSENGPLRVVSLRSLEPIYGVDVAIRAVARCRSTGVDITLTIAGDGSLRGSLEALADELGVVDVVTFVGRLPEPDIAGLLSDHDVHLSTSYSDGSAISLLQALAVGRPSIVTAIRSNLEWVAPGINGWVFAAGDDASLASALALAVAERDQLEQMGTFCREVAERRADWKRNQRQIIAAYERALGSTGAGEISRRG